MIHQTLRSIVPPSLTIVQILPEAEHIVLVAKPETEGSCCPACGRLSQRVHSRYGRRLADLPWHGRVVEIRLQVRRFRCGDPGCVRRVFTERLSETVLPNARRTLRLGESQRAIGFAVGGEPGSRLAHKLAMPVSGDTLLRMVRAARLDPITPPRVVGIDDWAWRRGQRYGTIVCDLERNRVLDLLPDRNAETVAAWLERHPGVEIIARDRAGLYADGARRGAPGAVQVADRWHLLRNLGDTLRDAVGRHRKAVRTAGLAVAAMARPSTEPDGAAGSATTKLDALRQTRRDHRRDAYAEICRLRRAGLTPRLIAPLVGMSRRSVERWLTAGGEPEHRRPPAATTLIEPFQPFLERRWQDGYRTNPELWKDLVEQGFTGSLTTVARWTALRRAEHASRPAEEKARIAARWQPPSRRRCAGLLTCDPAALDSDERTFLVQLFELAPDLADAAALGRRFMDMIRSKQGEALDQWIAAASSSALRAFAIGIGRDRDAVRAAMTQPWSTSPVEGQINRLKAIKRQMYGRAHYPLLRQRMLAAP